MKKILIVEDDSFLRRALLLKFKRENFDLDSAIDGKEALEKVTKFQPDFIILDLMLPKKSGFDVLKELKKEEKTKNIPVLILTNLGQTEDLKKGLSLGAIDYLVKTEIKLEDLVKKIKNFLKESQNRRKT